MDENDQPRRYSGSRRRFLIGTALTGALPFVPRGAASQAATPEPPPGAEATVDVELRVNGQAHRLEVDARTTLLDALREHVGLTGAKKGCDHG